jgi:plasmid maintenance system antidote protein VapI
MKDRIINFLSSEKLSPARFAEIIGVQPANISHIISERNKPSLDFIQKMIKSFPQLNIEWLIMGSGKMYKEAKEQSLFNTENDLFTSSPTTVDDKQNIHKIPENAPENKISITGNENFEQKTDILPKPELKHDNRNIEQIIICYSDKTFEFYFPR